VLRKLYQMKHALLIYLTLISVLMMGSSFSNNKMTKVKIKITVNNQTFTATLLDNNSAKAFKEMLPLTIKMTELNGNEKYCDLKKSLPTNPTNPETITNGDIMLYGSETFVLFYDTFATSYRYTKLGQIDNATGLKSALGSGSVTVTVELY
jgi:hypothetical protein